MGIDSPMQSEGGNFPASMNGNAGPSPSGTPQLPWIRPKSAFNQQLPQLPTIKNLPPSRFPFPQSMAGGGPPNVTEITYLRIISETLGRIEKMGGKGGGNNPPKDKEPSPGHPLSRLGNFWSNIMSAKGGFSMIGKGLANGNITEMAAGASRAGQSLKFLEGMMGGGSKAGGAAAAAGGGGAGAGALAAVGEAAGPIGMVIGAVVALGSFISEVKNAADQLIEANKKLAEVSPSMGSVYGHRELRELVREMSRGEQEANSAGLLVRGEQRYRDEIFPWEVAWEELKNNFLSGFYETLADIASGVNEIMKFLRIEVGKRNANDTSNSFSGQVNKVADDVRRRQDEAKRKAGA